MAEAAPAPEEEDSGFALRKSKLEDSEMDIAPMIDCTFLLLIFFIVCSHIGKSTAVDLPKAKVGLPISAKQSIILTIAPGDGDMANVYKGDGMDIATLISAGSPQEQEDAIEQYVGENVDAVKDKPQVLIKAAKGLKHGEVSRVAKAAARAAEAIEMYVAVMEVK